MRSKEVHPHLELLEVVEDRGNCAPPRLRVRCPECRDVYITSQWPSMLKRTRGCRDCAARRRMKRRSAA